MHLRESNYKYCSEEQGKWKSGQTMPLCSKAKEVGREGRRKGEGGGERERKGTNKIGRTVSCLEWKGKEINLLVEIEIIYLPNQSLNFFLAALDEDETRGKKKSNNF